MMTKKSPAKTEVRDMLVMAVVASPWSNLGFVSVVSPIAGVMFTAGTVLCLSPEIQITPLVSLDLIFDLF